MSMWKIQNALTDTPVIGRRVLVWDRVYKAWVIAYWERDGQFVERQNGQARTVAAGRLWAELPEDQE